MFLFIGGIQPRTRVLNPTPQLCPRCGHLAALLKRVDRYVSLFFVPLFPVGRGEPILACDRCGYFEPLDGALEAEPHEWLPEPEAAPSSSPGPGGVVERCPACGATIGPAYRFCPQCGRRL